MQYSEKNNLERKEINKEINRNSQKNSGITLIALVLTIIILLILTGVSLRLISGSEGIIAKARWSEYVTEYEKVDEAKEMYVVSEKMKKYESRELRSIEREYKVASLSDVEMMNEQEKNIYPVTEKVSLTKIPETLRKTIISLENVTEEELVNEEKVNLYQVDFSLLNNIEVHREYVINVVTGMLYSVQGENYKGKIYHTPRIGEIGSGEIGKDDEENKNENENELIISPSEIIMEEGQTKEIKVTFVGQEIETRDIKWKNEEEDQEYQDDEEVPDIDDIEEYEEGEEEEERIETLENDYEDDVISIKDGKVIGEVVESTKVKATYKKDGKEYSTYLNVEVTGEEAEVIGITGQVDETGEIEELQKIEVNRGKRKSNRNRNVKKGPKCNRKI